MYLIHYNPYHDPKNGRFTDAKTNYVKVISSLNDEEFKRFTGDPNETKVENVKEAFKNIELQDKYKDSIAFVSERGNITVAGLNEHPIFGKQWSMGWATSPEARGSGITQENIKKAIEEIKKYSDLPISAVIEKDNIASIKTAEKAGFKEVIDIFNPDTQKTETKYVYGKDADDLKEKVKKFYKENNLY